MLLLTCWLTSSATAAHGVVPYTTPAARTVLDDPTTEAMRTTLGVAIGTNVQAYDADLTTWAGVSPHASWQDILDGTTTTAANNATIRSQLSVQKAHWIDVTEAPYNADNTGATDCSVAVQAAFAAAKAQDAALHFPTGTYLVTDTIGEVETGMIIFGDGFRKTVIDYDDSEAVAVFQLGQTVSQGYVTIRDLSIQGQNTTGYGISIGVDDSFYSAANIFENLYITSLARGIDHLHGWTNRFTSVHFLGCRYDFYLTMGNDLHFQKCRFDNAGTCAFWMKEGYTIELDQCTLQNSSHTLLRQDGGTLRCSNCYFENAADYILRIGDGSRVDSFRMEGGWIYSDPSPAAGDEDGVVLFDEVDDLVFNPDLYRYTINGLVYDSDSTRWRQPVHADANGLATTPMLQVGLNIGDPIGYWKLDDDAATTAVLDASDNGYDLTSQGNNTEDMQIDDGIVNGALEFDGSTDYAKVAAATFTGTSGTVMYWFRTDSVADWAYAVSSSDEGSSNRYLAFGRWADVVRCGQNDAGTLDDLRGSTTLKTNVWYHVAWVSDGSTVTCYLNGELETLAAETGANSGDWFGDTTGRDNFCIGVYERSALSAYWDGDLDDVRVYDDQLTRTQVDWIYQRQRMSEQTENVRGSVRSGKYSSGSETITATGPTDDVDVSGVSILNVDTGDNNVTVGGFTGGVAGQLLFVRVTDATNNAVLEHNEGGGSQDILLSDGADETITAGYGGWVLACDGTYWYEVTTGGGGYTDLTEFVDQNTWKMFYSDGSGDTTELALGADGTYLMSNGAAAAPTFETPAGSGDMTKAVYDVAANSYVDGDNTAYNATTWDNNPDAASKNAIRDKIETLAGGHDAVTLGTANGLSLSTQELSLAAATNASAGAATAAQITALEAIDTEAELEALLEVADLQGDLDADRIAGDTTDDDDLDVAAGGTGVSTLTDGGVLLGSGSSDVTAMAALGDGEMIVGDGTTDPVAESGATLRTSIGVGTGDSPQLAGIELGHASDTTLSRTGAGAIAVEGVGVVLAGSASHDGFSDFVANEHIDWTGDQGATDIHTGNIPDLSGTYEPADAAIVKSDEAETLTADWVNTDHPWADNEVADDITAGNATLATTVTVTDDEATNDAHELVFTTDNANLESDGTATYNPSTGVITATGFAGALTGNVTGDVSGSSATTTTAAVATTVTITDNESTAENNPLVFVADADPDGGNLGLESDGTAYYTPSTGVITATGFAGALTGNVTGDVTGNADTATTAGAVTNATFTTALTVNTGTLTLTADAANNSVLTIGAGAVSVSGTNTGDDDVPDAGDFGAATDLDENGAVAWGNLAEGELADSTVVSDDIKDGTVAVGDMASTLDLSSKTITLPSRTAGHSNHFRFNIFNPNAAYDVDTQICIVPKLAAAITITNIEVTCDSAANEIVLDLKWADAFIGLANAAVIDELDTTSGVASISAGFDDADVASGKCIYVEWQADPSADIAQVCIDITFDYD